MTRIDTLLVLLESEERACDAARQHLEHARRQASDARTQAEQLSAYREEYRRKWTARMSGACAIEILHHYQSFLARLDQALAQQRAAVERAAAFEQAAQHRLQAQQLKVASVEKLIERRRAAERQAAGRQEQKAFDEAATRAVARRLAGFPAA